MLKAAFHANDQRMGRIEQGVSAVLEQTTATNGRVRALELWQARMQGVAQGSRWTVALASGLVSSAASVGAVIGALKMLGVLP